MFEAALLAAAECRIDDLNLLFNDPELRKYWKFILSSIPETLHIDKYKHIIPKPTSALQIININDENKSLFNGEITALYDSVESISQWSIERCFQIVKNTLDIGKFALPFLTFMIRHLDSDILNKNTFSDDIQGKYLINHYESILMLYSFYFILDQFCIATDKNTNFDETRIDPVKFILNNPIDRLKIIMSKYSDSSYSKLEALFLSLFESYSSISYLNSLYDKQLNKESFESTKMIIRCKPLIEKCGVSGYFQQIYYNNKDINIHEKDLTDLLFSNACIPLEDTVIRYLFDEKKVISIELFCKISKILVKHSMLTKNLADRFISCPIRVIQFILLCIKGKGSPLLNLKALEIQEYIDDIYECTPKSTIIIKHFNKDMVFRKLKSANLKIDHLSSEFNFICCPFCKKASILYQNLESVKNLKDWQNDIFFSIESIERQQLFIDLCREFPIKMIDEMTIHDIHKTLYNPYNAECFLISLINKLPTFYTCEIMGGVISLHEIILNSIRLPNYPFGSLLSLLFYVLEKILIVKQNNIEIIIQDLANHIKSNITSIDEFKDLFLQLLTRVYNGYLEPPITNLTIFIHKLNQILILENKDINSQIKSIIESIHVSNIINILVRYLPKETEINSIFIYGYENELQQMKYSHTWTKYDFLYDNPFSILKESQKEKILNDLFLSNPSLVLISPESPINDNLIFLFKKFLSTEDNTIISNNLNRLQISTLLTYGFLNLAIKVIFNTVSNTDYMSDYIINILFHLSKNRKYMNGISAESYSFINKIEETILTSFSPNLLSLYLSYKCIPSYDKTIKINIKSIQRNIENYFLTKYHFENQYLKEDHEILNLFLMNNSNKSTMSIFDSYKKNINKYDLLICCSMDLLFMNGYKSRLIINSVNINQRIKIFICLSLISILSIKNLIPYTLNSIKSLLLTTSVIHKYSRVIAILQDLSLSNQDASKFIKFENDLPIYLIKYNSGKSLERWKLLLSILPFNEVAPLISMIDKVFNKNQLNKKPDLFSYIEVYYLTHNLITVNDAKIPLITDEHIKIFLNHPKYCCNILLQFYKKEKQESIKHIYTLLLLLILKYLSVKEIKKINEISLLDINKIRIFMQLYKLYPKLTTSITNQIITGEKSLIDLIDYSKVWNNYWLVLKLIKSFNKSLLSIFSFSLLKYVFFEEKRFPDTVYKSLITHNGNCISLILYDVLKNLLENDDNTFRFLHMLQNNKQKLEIISLLIIVLTKNDDYNRKKKLFLYLNTQILAIKIKLYFPNFEYNNELQGEDSYRQTLVFTLDLFMNSDENNINILITNILTPQKMDFFEILTEAIILYLTEVKIQNKSSNDISIFIKSIFEKSNSHIFSIYGTDFCDFILKLYNNILKNMGNNFIPFIFSIELASRNIFDIHLLNKLSNQVMSNIHTLMVKININVDSHELSAFLGEITNLILDQNHSVKLNRKTIFYLLCQLLYYMFVLNEINISQISKDFQMKNSDDKILFDQINIYKKNISELTLNLLTFIIVNGMINNQQFFKYWYIFGELLMNTDDQKLFYELNKKNIFIALNSSFKKYILTSITYFRMEEVLASKYYKRVSYFNIYELISCFNIILNSSSYSFLGTRLFSNLIIPILMNSKKENDYSFIHFGRHICGMLNIRYHDDDELSLIGIFFKTLLVYKKKIIHNLIPKLFALKSHNTIAEIVASESHILRYSPISVKYSYKILSKLFNRFYYVNFDTTRMEIEYETSNNHITPNHPYPLISYNLLDDIQYNEVSDIIYQKLLSKFYSFLFGEKHHLFEIKLADKKITSNI